MQNEEEQSKNEIAYQTFPSTPSNTTAIWSALAFTPRAKTPCLVRSRICITRSITSAWAANTAAAVTVILLREVGRSCDWIVRRVRKRLDSWDGRDISVGEGLRERGRRRLLGRGWVFLLLLVAMRAEEEEEVVFVAVW